MRLLQTEALSYSGLIFRLGAKTSLEVQQIKAILYYELLQTLDFPTTGKGFFLTLASNSFPSDAAIQNTFFLNHPQIDSDMHFNDTLTFSAVYSKGTFGVESSFSLH